MGTLQDEVTAGLSARYEVERELGRGGMAVVFLATDVRHGRPVAIKVLGAGVAIGPGAERFRREVRSVAALSHPHVLPVLDSGELPGDPPRAWYAMPYVAGGSLRDRLQREGALPVTDAVRIVAEAAEALDYAHRQGLIHRDVKPENILLQDGQAVVADFGIVGTTVTDAEGRLTSTGLVMGTARYMSPEQASGADAVDGRADIYALGCVLHEALTGQPPFPGASPQAIVARVMTEEPPPVSRERPAAASLDPIVIKARARLAGDRYRTAGELAQALRASTPAQGLAASPPPGPAALGGHPPRPSTWRRAAGVVGAGVVIGLGAFAAVTRWGPSPTSGPPSVAVLPFGNLSPDPEDAYFAAGVQEEIRTQLSKVDGIRLVAGQSLARYADTDRTLSEIADELGVSTILEGTVRRAGGDVRISVQLHDAVRDQQLWGQSYERQLLDVFEIQMDVGARVVEEIRSVLTPAELAELTIPTTDNEEALAHYMRGRARQRALYDPEDARVAAEAFGQAVELDPGFAAAWAGIVRSQLYLYWLWGVPEGRDVARAALDRLEELAPGSAEHRLAGGLWLYWGVLDFEDALAELEAAADLLPGDPSVQLFIGAIQRRLGRRREAVRTWEKLFELDPLNGPLASTLAGEFTTLRDFAEADRYGRLSVELEPEVNVHWWHWIWVPLVQGDTAEARVRVEATAESIGRERLEADGWWVLWQVYAGNFDQVVDSYRDFVYAENPRTLGGTWGRPWPLGLAAAAAAGRTETVRDFAESARSAATDALASAPPDDQATRQGLLWRLAIADAYLGDDEAAVDGVREAVALPSGEGVMLHLAHVYTVVGRHDEAVDQLRYLLSVPAEVNVGLLRLDPRWYPLRDHPGFRALIQD